MNGRVEWQLFQADVLAMDFVIILVLAGVFHSSYVNSVKANQR